MGEKILFYIKMFFKNKNKSHKSHSRHKRHSTLKHKRYSSKLRVKSSRRITTNDNSGRKTQKIGAFMRV